MPLRDSKNKIQELKIEEQKVQEKIDQLKEAEQVKVDGQTKSLNGIENETVTANAHDIDEEKQESLYQKTKEWFSSVRQSTFNNAREAVCIGTLALTTISAVPAGATAPQDRPWTDFTDPKRADYAQVQKDYSSKYEMFEDQLFKRDVDVENVYAGSLGKMLLEDYEEYPGGLEQALDDVRKMRNDVDLEDGGMYGSHDPTYTLQAIADKVPVAVTNVDDIQNLTLSKTKSAAVFLPGYDGVVMPEDNPAEESRRSIIRQELLHRWQIETADLNDNDPLEENILVREGVELNKSNFDDEVLASQDNPDEHVEQMSAYAEYLGLGPEIDSRLSSIRQEWIEAHPGERIDSLEKAHEILEWGTNPDRVLSQPSEERSAPLEDIANLRHNLDEAAWEKVEDTLAKRLASTI